MITSIFRKLRYKSKIFMTMEYIAHYFGILSTKNRSMEYRSILFKNMDRMSTMFRNFKYMSTLFRNV